MRSCYLVACKEGLCGFLTKLDGDLRTRWATEPIENLYYVKSAVQIPAGDCFMVGQHGSGKGIHIVRWNAEGRFVDQAVIMRSTFPGQLVYQYLKIVPGISSVPSGRLSSR